MLQIVQLQDGNYRVIIDYSENGFAIHKEYIFTPCESSASVDPEGEKIVLAFAKNG